MGIYALRVLVAILPAALSRPGDGYHHNAFRAWTQKAGTVAGPGLWQ